MYYYYNILSIQLYEYFIVCVIYDARGSQPYSATACTVDSAAAERVVETVFLRAQKSLCDSSS